MAVMRGNRVGGNWLMKWDELKKIPMVHYRVMHRKRVTSELHDSYFRLMTIKHSISKIQLSSNDYITQLSSTSQLNWVPVPVEFYDQEASGVASRVPDSWRRNVVGKATSGRRGFWALMSWGPEKMLIRCNKESQHRAEWIPGLRLSIRRTRKTQRDGHKSEGSKYYSLCSVSSSLSHANPTQPFRTLTNKVRGIYICKEVFLRLCHCVCLYYACVC